MTTEKQYRTALKRAKESFITHVNKFGKIGSKGFPLTKDNDIVLWSETPKSTHRFKLAIESPKREKLWVSKVYEIPVMNEKNIENTINQAIKDTYTLTADKFTES